MFVKMTLCFLSLFVSQGTCHDWRLRCGAVDLYFTLFGLSRPSCLPLPELGLVLNLKEKKAVLNPTIIPEPGANGPEPPNNPNSLGQIVGFQSTVSEFHLPTPDSLHTLNSLLHPQQLSFPQWSPFLTLVLPDLTAACFSWVKACLHSLP